MIKEEIALLKGDISTTLPVPSPGGLISPKAGGRMLLSSHHDRKSKSMSMRASKYAFPSIRRQAQQ